MNHDLSWAAIFGFLFHSRVHPPWQESKHSSSVLVRVMREEGWYCWVPRTPPGT
ncbi:hypothetical protein ABZT47_27960 [Sphaerisporangium sp. NPDC005289]|uniref:hypothetical protein n=1 Tax=Sphaerisporangium sp. NPDC005289 TaxID=3155247 RepID=UPI0033AF1111